MRKITRESSLGITLVALTLRSVLLSSLLLSSLLLSSALLSGCSQYKSSWSCKNPEGIGCSSIVYADQIARKHIILNGETKTKQKDSNTLLIKEHYSDFEKFDTKEVEID